MPAICVESLSKVYSVHHAALRYGRYRTLREDLVSLASAPWRKVKKFFGERGSNGNGESDEEFWALKDVSFDVEPGEVVGIIGRNGAGKSTLLKILSRITPPTSGQVTIDGRVGSLLEVGTGFHPELTGRENIFMNGSILGMTRREIQRKFDEIVDFSEIEKFLDTPVKRYSSGMYVRLAFAVAAHLEPEILIVDEVLAVGDAEFQKKCLGKMEDVAGRGRTVLFVSHNMNSVVRLCGRGVLLSEGRVATLGDAEAVVARYLAQHHQAERVWNDPDQAPGDDIVRLRSVRVCTSDGQLVDAPTLDAALQILVEYDVLADGHVLVPNLHFFTGDGTCILVSHECERSWHGRAKPRGRYVSRALVPAHLLNTGWLQIGAAITTYRPFVVHCYERDSVLLQVIERGESDIGRGGHTGHIPGTVRPLLDWKTTMSG
jgi:lipopolysaccharide transport system ATP-binding protein